MLFVLVRIGLWVVVVWLLGFGVLSVFGLPGCCGVACGVCSCLDVVALWCLGCVRLCESSFCCGLRWFVDLCYVRGC